MKMKIAELTKEFFIKNWKEILMQETETEEKRMKRLLGYVDDYNTELAEYEADWDEDDLAKRKSAIDKLDETLQDCVSSVQMLEELILFEQLVGLDADWLEDELEKAKEAVELDEKLCHLADEYVKIIKELPNLEYEIDFSMKSPSIYLKTAVAATEENVEDFLYCNSGFGVSCENVYEEDEDFNPDKMIEIRLSDHDFGGFTKFDGYGDYVSYRKSCVNYVVML